MPTSLGSCIVSNQVENLPDALLQARVAGKTWQQIAEEFNFGSPSGARSAFKKLTGITDFKIKGKALQNFIDADLLDELKKPIIKVTKAEKAALKAEKEFVQALKADGFDVPSPATHEAFTKAAPSSSNLTGEHIDIFHAAFPDKPSILDVQLTDTAQLDTYTLQANHKIWQKAEAQSVDVFDTYSENIVDKVEEMIGNGSFYSDINKATGMAFEDIDTLAWRKLIFDQTATDNNFTSSTVWKAYKKKPTSENGFQAVQDMVWNMRKMGIEPSDIAKASGVDDNVVNLIMDDKWTLPTKGSTQYVGYKPVPAPSSFPPSAFSGSSTYTQTSSELVGEGAEFKNMTEAQADYWADHLGKDLTPQEISALKNYTGSGYHEINGYLRHGTVHYGDAAQLEKVSADISSSMRPMLEDVTVHRKVGVDTFGGKVPEVGDAFSDKGFMSTSYGSTPGYGSGGIHMIIDTPKGSLARPVQQLSSAGKREREILLDRNQKFIVTGVKRDGRNATVYLRLIT